MRVATSRGVGSPEVLRLCRKSCYWREAEVTEHQPEADFAPGAVKDPGKPLQGDSALCFARPCVRPGVSAHTFCFTGTFKTCHKRDFLIP